MELGALTSKVLRGSLMEDVLEKKDWSDFEETVGNIFEANGFSVRRNFRFKTGRRFENDIIAHKGSVVFCVDCKRWSSGRSKRWGISKSARDQGRRTKEMEKFLKSNPIAAGIMKIEHAKFTPMIVTLHQEESTMETRTIVVPVGKLNSFLLSFEHII